MLDIWIDWRREMSDTAKCAICGEPMPIGEEMFKFHGYSGDCQKPPVPKKPVKQKIPGLVWAVAAKDKRTVSMMFDTNEQANAFVASVDADEPHIVVHETDKK